MSSVFSFVERKLAERREVRDYVEGISRREPTLWRKMREEREAREIADGFDVKRELAEAVVARKAAGLD